MINAIEARISRKSRSTLSSMCHIRLSAILKPFSVEKNDKLFNKKKKGTFGGFHLHAPLKTTTLLEPQKKQRTKIIIHIEMALSLIPNNPASYTLM